MQVDIKNIAGDAVGKVELSSKIFEVELNEGLLHDVVKAYRANRRQGTHATKTRSFVSGSGKKPFKQKGTGSARQGSNRGPHMPGGAVAHGPQPRDYRQLINKKTKKLSVCVALSEKLRHNKLIIVDDFNMDRYSTSHVTKIMKAFNCSSMLAVDDRSDDFLYKSSRNIYKTASSNSSELNAEQLLRHDTVLVSKNALEQLSKRLGE